MWSRTKCVACTACIVGAALMIAGFSTGGKDTIFSFASKDIAAKESLAARFARGFESHTTHGFEGASISKEGSDQSDRGVDHKQRQTMAKAVQMRTLKSSQKEAKQQLARAGQKSGGEGSANKRNDRKNGNDNGNDLTSAMTVNISTIDFDRREGNKRDRDKDRNGNNQEEDGVNMKTNNQVNKRKSKDIVNMKTNNQVNKRKSNKNRTSSLNENLIEGRSDGETIAETLARIGKNQLKLRPKRKP